MGDQLHQIITLRSRKHTPERTPFAWPGDFFAFLHKVPRSQPFQWGYLSMNCLMTVAGPCVWHLLPCFFQFLTNCNDASAITWSCNPPLGYLLGVGAVGSEAGGAFAGVGLRESFGLALEQALRNAETVMSRANFSMILSCETRGFLIRKFIAASCFLFLAVVLHIAVSPAILLFFFVQSLLCHV